MQPITINKHATSFKVFDDYRIPWCPNGFFTDKVQNGNWERETFEILDLFSNNDGVYIDIGAWIGPTVLYAADKYKRIVCFEPDPVAVESLRRNINLNDFHNIEVIEKAVAEKIGCSKFGGNGVLGNSESTLLVSDDNYVKQSELPGQRGSVASRNQHIINVRTITLDQALQSCNVKYEDISLLKIDIEGGEWFVLPTVANVLSEFQVPLYISLHPMFLMPEQTNTLIDLLFDIYSQCHVYDSKINRLNPCTKQEVMEEGFTSLAFL